MEADSRSVTGSAADTRMIDRAAVAVLMVGAFLRLVQYGAGASMFLGELALARNLTDRGVATLLAEPLGWGQVVPYGYLLLEKLVVTMAGTSEWAFRFVPFVASLVSLPLFHRLARQFVSGPALLLANLAFAVGVPFIVYAGQIKPYGSVEVAGSLAMTLIALAAARASATRPALFLGLGGLLLPWFAQSAILVAVGAGAVLLAGALAGRFRSAAVAPAVGLWLVGAILAVIATVHATEPATRAAFRTLFAGSYLPALPALGAEVAWLWRVMVEAAGRPLFRYPLAAAVVAAGGLGALVLVRRHRGAALILLAPILAGIAASAVGFYPFRGQYLLYLFPAVFVAMAAAADLVRGALASRSRPAAFAWMAAWASVPLVAIAKDPPVYRLQEMKPVLAYVRDHRRPGDAVYAFFGARQAMQFYGANYGLPEADYQVGECHHGEPRRYFEELDRYRGRPRVWVIVTHDAGRARAREEIVGYLSAIGTLRDSVVITRGPLPPFAVGAFAYLFDLSDSTRLASVTAATMPLRHAAPADPRFACGWGPVGAEAQ